MLRRGIGAEDEAADWTGESSEDEWSSEDEADVVVGRSIGGHILRVRRDTCWHNPVVDLESPEYGLPAGGAALTAASLPVL